MCQQTLQISCRHGDVSRTSVVAIYNQSYGWYVSLIHKTIFLLQKALFETFTVGLNIFKEVPFSQVSLLHNTSLPPTTPFQLSFQRRRCILLCSCRSVWPQLLLLKTKECFPSEAPNLVDRWCFDKQIITKDMHVSRLKVKAKVKTMLGKGAKVFYKHFLFVIIQDLSSKHLSFWQ